MEWRWQEYYVQGQKYHPDDAKMTKKKAQLFSNTRKEAVRARNLEYRYSLLLLFRDSQKEQRTPRELGRGEPRL